VYIASFSPLGDNHLEIKPGAASAPLAAPGSTLQTKPYVGLNELSEQINKLAPQAQELIGNLNLRVKELSVTIARVNDLLNDKNRANISASIADLHGMLADECDAGDEVFIQGQTSEPAGVARHHLGRHHDVAGLQRGV